MRPTRVWARVPLLGSALAARFLRWESSRREPLIAALSISSAVASPMPELRRLSSSLVLKSRRWVAATSVGGAGSATSPKTPEPKVGSGLGAVCIGAGRAALSRLCSPVLILEGCARTGSECRSPSPSGFLRRVRGTGSLDGGGSNAGTDVLCPRAAAAASALAGPCIVSASASGLSASSGGGRRSRLGSGP